MRVYKDRFGSLREVLARSRATGTRPSSSTASGASPSPSSSRVQRGRRRPGRPGRRPRRPGGGAVRQQAGVVRGVLGHRQPGGGPRRAQRLVEDRRDPLRPGGLRRQGAGGRREALRAHRRRAGRDALPTSRRCSSPTPTRPTRRRARLHPFDELADGRRGRPPPRSTRATPRSSSTRAARRAAQGGGLDPSRAWSPTSRTRCSTRSPARWPTPPRRRSATEGGGQTVGTAHLAAVPRGGLPLQPRGGALGGLRLVMPEGRFEPEKALRSSRPSRSRSGPPCPPWSGGSASTPTATTTTRPR